MKRLKLSFVASILTIAFAVSTSMAGQMPFGITSPPPPPTETSATGQMPGGVTSSSEGDPFTEFTLSLLQSVLALF